MTPIPWPPVFRTGRRRKPAPAPPAVRYPAEPPMPVNPAPSPYAHLNPAEEHDLMRARCPWLRREEDVILPRLARLTDRTDPWTAARRMFADDDQTPPADHQQPQERP